METEAVETEAASDEDVRKGLEAIQELLKDSSERDVVELINSGLLLQELMTYGSFQRFFRFNFEMAIEEETGNYYLKELTEDQRMKVMKEAYGMTKEPTIKTASPADLAELPEIK